MNPFKTKALPFYFVGAWLLLFGVVPLVLILVSSFLSQHANHTLSMPLTLNHYLALMTPEVLQITLRSLGMASITTMTCLLVAYPFSYMMVKSKHQSLLLILIIIPFWTSSLIRTYALIAMLKLHGLLNNMLLSMHLIQQPLALLYSNWAVMIGLTYTLFPFMVLPLFTQMQRFDFQLLDAAQDLGASKFMLFWRVFLPNTIPGIATGSLLVFLPAMTLFYIPNVLGGARSILLGNFIQNQFFVEENWPQGCASSILLTTAILILMVLKPKTSEK